MRASLCIALRIVYNNVRQGAIKGRILKNYTNNEKFFLCYKVQSESHHRLQNAGIFHSLSLDVTNVNMTIALFSCVKVCGLCELISTDLSNKYMAENCATVYLSKWKFTEWQGGQFYLQFQLKVTLDVPSTVNMQSNKLFKVISVSKFF